MVTSPKPYDVVFSLGAACSCSQSLRAAELQFCGWDDDCPRFMVKYGC